MLSPAVMRLTADMDLGGPATLDAIAEAERELGVKLPRDYAEFLLGHNGGEGPVGEGGWARFYPAEELVQYNVLYSGLDHLAGWLLFGTNGGNEAYVFDDGGQVLVVPWIGGREDALPQGRFGQFLRRLADSTMFD